MQYEFPLDSHKVYINHITGGCTEIIITYNKKKFTQYQIKISKRNQDNQIAQVDKSA